jgi:hypothetical protein
MPTLCRYLELAISVALALAITAILLAVLYSEYPVRP